MVCYAILRNSDGNRYVLYLDWYDGQWNWNVNWLENDWNANNPSAVLATHFISLPTSCWESFVLRVDRANHRASYLFHPSVLTEQCIFYYLKILFPRVSSTILLEYLFFSRLISPTVAYLLWVKNLQWLLLQLFLQTKSQFVDLKNVCESSVGYGSSHTTRYRGFLISVKSAVVLRGGVNIFCIFK